MDLSLVEFREVRLADLVAYFLRWFSWTAASSECLLGGIGRRFGINLHVNRITEGLELVKDRARLIRWSANGDGRSLYGAGTLHR